MHRDAAALRSRGPARRRAPPGRRTPGTASPLRCACPHQSAAQSSTTRPASRSTETIRSFTNGTQCCRSPRITTTGAGRRRRGIARCVPAAHLRGRTPPVPQIAPVVLARRRRRQLLARRPRSATRCRGAHPPESRPRRAWRARPSPSPCRLRLRPHATGPLVRAASGRSRECSRADRCTTELDPALHPERPADLAQDDAPAARSCTGRLRPRRPACDAS